MQCIKRKIQLNNKFLKALVSSLILSISSLANAGLITSESDSALQGANFIDFESFSLGEYNELDFDGGIFESNGPGDIYSISDDWNDYNENQGRALANWNPSKAFVLRFDNSISAFGLTIGAINSDWNFTLFDVNDVLIGSFSTLNGCCESRYIGFSASNIQYIEFSPLDDRAVFDSLSFVHTDVPEPSILVVFSLGLMGLAFRVLKKKA